MEKYHTVIKDYYIKTLDISKALEEERRLKELDQKLEEEKQRKEEEARLKAEQEAEREVAANEETVIKTEENVSIPTETVSETPESVSNLSETVQIPDEVVQAENVVTPPTGDVTVTDPFAPQEDTKQYKASFTIFGTKAEIMAVKQYMIDNNIKFRKVEK